MAEPLASNLLDVAYEDALLYQIVDSEELYSDEYEMQMLQRLHEQSAARRLNEQTYRVLARTAIWLPRQQPQAGEKLPIELHYNEALTARFDSFHTLHLPIQGGAKWWRMLCFSFEDVRLSANNECVPADKVLRVPVLEVGEIACLGFGPGR